MKLTNKSNLPEPLVNAVANDPYSRGDADISVTQLLSPPRKVALEDAHKDELEEDASDRIYSLLGQAIHTILERAASSGIAEGRFSTPCEGWKVSGGLDYYKDGLIQDYKVTTVWKFKNNGVPVEFEQQLNLLAELLRQNGHKVVKLQIVGILRDWSKLEAARDPGYPQSQVIVRDVALWPSTQAFAFMRQRVILHRQARFKLPECTNEERWQKPDFYAVMKPGGKRALKLHTSLKDATTHVQEVPELIIKKRPGESTRCKNYCSASKFCDQYKKELESDQSSAVASDAVLFV